MSKKEKLFQLLKDYGIDHIYTSEGFDLEEDFPYGDILIPGNANHYLQSYVYDMYSTDESLDAGQILFVYMYAENSTEFSSLCRRCKEVHYV